MKNKTSSTNKNGTKFYYVDGKLHKDNGPAIEFFTGTKEWYQNDKLHREDGPAIDSAHIKVWYKNGEIHREDGPAIEGVMSERKEWWHHGVKFEVSSTKEFIQKLRLMVFE